MAWNTYRFWMFDDLPLPKKDTNDFPRDLENMSIGELEDYIAELQNEIARVQSDIAGKKASQEAAAAAFKE